HDVARRQEAAPDVARTDGVEPLGRVLHRGVEAITVDGGPVAELLLCELAGHQIVPDSVNVPTGAMVAPVALRHPMKTVSVAAVAASTTSADGEPRKVQPMNTAFAVAGTTTRCSPPPDSR